MLDRYALRAAKRQYRGTHLNVREHENAVRRELHRTERVYNEKTGSLLPPQGKGNIPVSRKLAFWTSGQHEKPHDNTTCRR
jgi:hypothetical protein